MRGSVNFGGPAPTVMPNKVSKYHDLALEIAKIYIERSKDKHDFEKDFNTLCNDFFQKYNEALKIFENINNK